MSGRFTVSGSIRKTFGLDPEHETEAEFYMTDDNDFVMVGMGFRAYNDDVTTMQLLYARLCDDGQIDQDDLLMIKRGIRPDNPLEVWFQCGNPREVIVGCGVRIKSDDVLTLHVHTRKLDPTTGRLIDPYTHRAGKDPNSALEANGQPEQDTEHTLLRGVGIRCYNDDVTTLALYFGTLSVKNG
jgi:hypothetical protein